jgi:hypothetical protein
MELSITGVTRSFLVEPTIRFLRFRFFLRSSDAVSLHVTLWPWV